MFSGPGRMLTKSTDCQRDEKACKTRKQTCRQGSLHGVSDRRLHVQLTQEAKIASDFSLFRAIFAFAGFVSALTGPDVFRPRIFIAAPPALALPGSVWTRQAFRALSVELAMPPAGSQSRPLSGGFLFGFMQACKGFTAALPYSLLYPFSQGKDECLAHGCKPSCIHPAGRYPAKIMTAAKPVVLTEPHKA